jgi:hypothetical protein
LPYSLLEWLKKQIGEADHRQSKAEQKNPTTLWWDLTGYKQLVAHPENNRNQQSCPQSSEV